MLLLCLHFIELTYTLKRRYNNSIGTGTTCFYQSSSVEFCGTVFWVLICSYRTLLNLPTLWPSIGGHQRGFPPQIGHLLSKRQSDTSHTPWHPFFPELACPLLPRMQVLAFEFLALPKNDLFQIYLQTSEHLKQGLQYLL